MALTETLLLERSLLYIAILTTIFFFGDYISVKIKDYSKKKSEGRKFKGFIICLFFILLLSAIPVIVAELILDSFPDFIWLVIIILLIINFLKYSEKI